MRLIDADALIEVLQNREIHAESVDKRIAIKGDRQVVINAPTIDACPYYHHEPTGEPFCEMGDGRRKERGMSEIKLTSTYYLPEVITALIREGYTLEVKQGRNEDEIIIRWASADRKIEQMERSEE